MVQGIFKCYIHDFGTNEADEWDKHKLLKEHIETGAAPCNQCGVETKFKFKGKLGKVPPALCKSCVTKLLKGSEDV